MTFEILRPELPKRVYSIFGADIVCFSSCCVELECVNERSEDVEVLGECSVLNWDEVSDNLITESEKREVEKRVEGKNGEVALVAMTSRPLRLKY
jgi:hypothetical protein